MKKEYYYLISSLVELSLDTGKLPITTAQFINFCSEEMDEKDFIDLKKIFIFNDIQNALFYKDRNINYKTPSFYSEEDFKENLKDTDTFFQFLAEFFYNKKNEKRETPDLLEIDESFSLLYKNIEAFSEGFLRDYFIFELNLRNITTALSLISNNLSITNKIIPYEYISDTIKKSTSPDLGLSKHIDYIEELTEIYKNNDLIKIEKTIEDIRWKWLDDRVGNNYFSSDFIFAYSVKLNSVERWNSLTDKMGEEKLNNLIENISMNIKFPDQYLQRR